MEKLQLANPKTLQAKPPRKNKPYSTQEKAEYCERWRLSGLSRKVFCQQEHICRKSLKRWLEERPVRPNKVKPSDGVIKMLPVSLAPKIVGLSEEKASQILMSFPNGSAITLPFQIDAGMARFIKELIS
jgi:hypothetical protein